MPAELDGIAGEDDYVPLGHVPPEWCDERRLGKCTAQGSYADIYSANWVGRLRQTLASECLKLGLEGPRRRYSPTRKTASTDTTVVT
jgi:hypothetical protein